MSRLALSAACGLGALCALAAAPPQEVPWVADLGDGTYRNPVLFADYSDPDVVRVGADFYMTASSFTNTPGLPVLHSRDLVNWRLIGHALPRLVPVDHHATPRRGGGVWAPAIRHRNGEFLIYYPDPDFGIFRVAARDPAGPWSEPELVMNARGAIDPAPFWDDDGRAYLLVAWARSRAGINNVLTLYRMDAAGRRTEGDGTVIVDGSKLPPASTSNGPMPWTTIEGPKLYKKDGDYYIFAPAGGVKPGWQGVFRSRSLMGPYDARNVMDQGSTDVNGPHQGGWTTTAQGEDWFVHFQDMDSYGRVVHLQPMAWKDGWPVIGADPDGDGRGEPVGVYRKPSVGEVAQIAAPQTSDEFDGPRLSLAWQWHANPMGDWASLTAAPGFLRLKSASASANLYEAANLLTQKLSAPELTATTRLRFSPKAVGEQAGLVVFGCDYAWIGLRKTAGGLRLVQVVRKDANSAGAETETEAAGADASSAELTLRVTVSPVVVPLPAPKEGPFWPAMTRARHARCRFSYSLDGRTFIALGEEFVSRPGRWVGAQVGLFSIAPTGTPANVATEVGYAEFDWFRVTK
jgi:beta-xylosidase